MALFSTWQLIIVHKRKIIIGIFIYMFFIIFSYSNFYKNHSPRFLIRYISDQFIDGGESLFDKLGLDIHLEGNDHLHSGLTNQHHHKRKKDGKIVIAIGGGITSKGIAGVTYMNIESKFDIFSIFIPSFCATISEVEGYSFQFYLAYDSIDNFFSNHSFLTIYRNTFFNTISKHCPKNTEAGIHFVQCTHFGKPAWAQNDAMLEAYLDDVDFHYRINDDTKFISSNWIERFISILKGYNPPMIGVVGPNHAGGNVAILTYDFVHTTHVDIFGFYYPKLFTDWWGDDWMTYVYKPDRSTKLMDIKLAHTLRLGQRYSLKDRTVGNKLKARLINDQRTLNRYIAYTNSKKEVTNLKFTKVVAMSIYGTDANVLWGVIRNAQLMPIYLPDWRMRVYTPLHHKITLNNSTSTPDKSFVPKRIINKLLSLGVDVYQIPKPLSTLSDIWPLKAFDDETLTHVLIRNPRFRISERESFIINEWMNYTSTLHCIRDHPQHITNSLPRALWGADLSKLRSILKGQSLYELAIKYFSENNFKLEWKSARYLFNESFNSTTLEKNQSSEPIVLMNKKNDFLEDVVYNLFHSELMCHDSVSSCDHWPHQIRRIFIKRTDNEFIGQKFDSRHDAENNEPILPPQRNDTCKYILNTSLPIPSHTISIPYLKRNSSLEQVNLSTIRHVTNSTIKSNINISHIN